MTGWRTKGRLARGGVVLAAIVGGFGATGAAQDARDSATARALFKEGVELAGADDWQGAADRFRRALELHPTPQIRFNLARSLGHTGALVEASEHLARIVRVEDAPARVRRDADALKEAIDKRIGRLLVQVEGDRSGAVVELDDQPLSDAALGVAVPADPGWHVLRLVRNGDELDRHEVEVPEGELAEVRLQAAAAVPTPREAARAAPDTPAGEEPPPSRHPAHLYGPVALGALGLAGAAVALGSLAGEECKERSADGRCLAGRRIRTGPTIAYGATGGAAIVAAFLWYVLAAPDDSDPPKDEVVSIDIGPKGAAVRGRF